MRRAFFTLLLLCSALLAPGRAADVSFVRVWPGWRTAESFERISEYFTNQENTGSEVVIRTHPEHRAGFYFLVRVRNEGSAVEGAKFVLQVVAPTSPDTKSYTFAANVAPRQSVFELGLTGADWPDAEAHPVAWKVDLLGADGKVIASQQSFLWEKPAK